MTEEQLTKEIEIVSSSMRAQWQKADETMTPAQRQEWRQGIFQSMETFADLVQKRDEVRNA